MYDLIQTCVARIVFNRLRDDISARADLRNTESQ